MRKYKALFGFGGLGPGARGVLKARIRLEGVDACFESLGSIDIDPIACRGFEYLTSSPAWCTDVRAITGAMLRARYGNDGPDFIFGSPPCQGATRLLPASKAKSQHYEDLNELTLIWIDSILDAWGHAPPQLILIENVPGLQTRAAEMLAEVKRKLARFGYVFNQALHDCGEIGGLAQHRVRFLLIARHAPTCGALLYEPPKRRVRGVGEVLETLPMPATRAAAPWGALHHMPRLLWRNWLRIALVPAGGDWRDLDGVLQGRARREVFRRHAVQRWDEPHPAVTGPGGHSVGNVADPRVELHVKRAYDAGYGVLRWDEPARTITGTIGVGCGAYAVADPRSRDALQNVRVMTIDEAMALDLDPGKAPPFIPVIISSDKTWHRPMTILELAALQGIPAYVNGNPLVLEGTRDEIATHIGNAVPVGTGEAIGMRGLSTLLGNELSSFSLDSSPIWVSH